MKQIARESQNLSVPEIKQACFFPSGRFLWISSNLPKIAYSLLVLHILSVAVLGFFELPGWFSYLATLPGLFAVPLVSWHLVRKTELLYSRLFKKTYVASSATILSGIILIACIPALFDFFSSLSLDLIGRLLELTTIVISVAVMSGLVLIAIGLADFIFLATNQFHRFSQKLILLLVVTGFGTFFWLSFVGVQIHSVLEWAIKQGHLEVYTVGLEELSQSSGLYIQGIAGALSMEIPFLIILAWRFGNRATSGISLISEGLNRVSHGDYTTKIVVSGNDEIGAIQQGFNEMLDATAEKSFLEKTFGQYVSPQVLETIRMNGREAMIQSERKNGTVVFTDICGFTAMSSELSPEQVISVLNKYMSLMIDVIHKHDGYINKFVGDAIMVLFNIPVEQDSHVQRALACTAEMQRTLAQANEDGLFKEVERIDISAGINTGFMVMGNLGNESQMEFTVIGDAVNVSSRACSHASAGEIVITETVYEELKKDNDEFQLEGESVKVKGKGDMIFYTIKSDSKMLDQYL